MILQHEPTRTADSVEEQTLNNNDTYNGKQSKCD